MNSLEAQSLVETLGRRLLAGVITSAPTDLDSLGLAELDGRAEDRSEPRVDIERQPPNLVLPADSVAKVSPIGSRLDPDRRPLVERRLAGPPLHQLGLGDHLRTVGSQHVLRLPPVLPVSDRRTARLSG